MKKYNAYSSTFIVLLIVFISVVSIGITKTVDNLAQKETERRFQNIYSAYTQALINTVVEMSGETGCYFTQEKNVPPNFSTCDEFYQRFVANLKLEKYCQDKALQGGCIPEYEEYTTKPQCIGFTKSMMNYYDDAFLLKDGSNLIVYNKSANQRRPIFAVDSNGFSKPNKAGEDLFSMTIMRNINGSYYFHSNVSYCLPVGEKGIHYLSDIYK